MVGDKHAFVVGVSEYLQVPHLKFGAKDATDIADALQTVGFKDVVVLHDQAELPPQRHIIFDQLGGLNSTLDPDDVLLFYFSGHGMMEKGSDYLLPIEASSKALKNTAIALQDAVDQLTASGSKNVVMFVDACRDELKTGKGIQSIGANAKSVINNVDDGGIAAFFSCQDNERSYEIDSDEIKQSAFTYCLLEAIRKREIRTVDETAAFLASEVKNLNGRFDLNPQKPYLHPNPNALGPIPIIEILGVSEQTTEYDEYVRQLAEMRGRDELSGRLFWDVVEFLKSPDDFTKLKIIGDLCGGETTPSSFEMIWTTLRGRVGSWGTAAVGSPSRGLPAPGPR